MRAQAAPRSHRGHRARQLIWRAAVLVALAFPVAAADDAAEYQQKLEQLRENISELKQQLESVKTRKGRLEEKLETSETEIGDLKEKIDTITDQLEDGQEELKQLNKRQQSLRRERQSQKTKIAAQVRSAYRAGPQSPLKILLDQQSPERLTRLHKYHDYFIRARRDKLADYLDTLQELKQIQPRISERQDQLAERKQQLGQRQRQLREQQSRRAQTLEELAGIIADKDAELAAQRQDSQRLQQLLDEMTATVGSSRPTPSGKAFSGLKGQLPWPAKGELRHRYGSAKMAGQLDWEGMVITASEGAPVRAVHSGRVIFAEYLRGHGLLLIVDHGEGYMSLYAHNQQLLKRPGDAVAGGEIIARMGQSGGQRYTGLYFEIRHNGRPTDPADWLANA